MTPPASKANDDSGDAFLEGNAIRLRAERLLKTTYAACRDWHVAEDAIQEAYAAYQALTREQRQALHDPESWLIKISVYLAISRQRREGTRNRTEQDYARMRDPHSLPNDQGAENAPPPDECHPVMERLATLSPRRREVLWQRIVEGRPFADIAKQMGMKEATARATFHQALSAIRNDLISS